MEHCGRIGSALWEFVWCIDKITKERDGIGLVFGGAPVKIEDIAADLERGEHSVRRNLKRLEDKKYIERTRTPYGFTISVRNSRKFQIWSKRENVKHGQSLPPESGPKWPHSPSNLADLTVKNGRNKEDATIDATVDTAAAAFWKQVGINPLSIPVPFRKTCEELLAAKNGQPLGEFMGMCMDAWKAFGGKTYPPAFARAKARIVTAEKEQAGLLPELEAIPWQKK
jgi:hypothetical protein